MNSFPGDFKPDRSGTLFCWNIIDVKRKITKKGKVYGGAAVTERLLLLLFKKN